MSNNPLDFHDIFHIELMNPNPTSSKTKDGPMYRVSFELADRESWSQFMDANTKGMVINCAMQVMPPQGYIEPSKEKPVITKGSYGELAKWIHQSGLLRMPAMWQVLGTEAIHKKWVQSRPCVVCGDCDQHPQTGEPVCEESHVRTSDNAGTSYKPPYISVPMCHACHEMQHNKGYLALIPSWNEFRKKSKNAVETTGTPEQASQDMLGQLKTTAIKYTTDWAHQALCAHYGIDSLTKLAPSALSIFLTVNNIQQEVPKKYLEQG
jgi:hypothetical protein